MASNFNGLGMNMGNLSWLSNAQSRSTSAENCTVQQLLGDAVPDHCAYFHAQFRRVNPLPYKDVFTIVDGVKGRGHYVGTYMAWGVNNNGWWGEGEVKFYLDRDQNPNICGTYDFEADVPLSALPRGI